MNNTSLSKHIDQHFKQEEDLDKKYPNRTKRVHKVCCKHCPSNNGKVDLETEEYKSLPKETLAKNHLFVCAWRRSKLCKGICNQYNINQEYLDAINND